MPFTNYREVVSYGAMVAFVTQSRYMPPWRAAPQYGAFHGALQLSDQQIQKIQDWKAAGFPQGQPLPADNWQTYQQSSLPPIDWDLELKMQESFEQFDIFFDQYQVFRLPTGLTEDRWVDRIEFVPGDSSIVRYAAVAINQHSISQELDDWDPRPGYSSFGWFGFLPDQDAWYSWSLGQLPDPHPGRTFLPAGTELLLYVHYGPTDEYCHDQSSLRLSFTKAESTAPIRYQLPLLNPTNLQNPKWQLPAEQRTIFHCRTLLPWPIRLYALEPRAMLFCQSWEVFARLPDGSSLPLLKIPEYDFHWRRNYRLAEPVDLPAGTELLSFAHYDNRSTNVNNPLSPPQEVSWGYRLFQEQCSVHFEFSFLQPKPTSSLLPGSVNQLLQERRLRSVFLENTEVQYTLHTMRDPDTALAVTTLSATQPTGELKLNTFSPGIYFFSSQEGNSTAYHDPFLYWPEQWAKVRFHE